MTRIDEQSIQQAWLAGEVQDEELVDQLIQADVGAAADLLSRARLEVDLRYWGAIEQQRQKRRRKQQRTTWFLAAAAAMIMVAAGSHILRFLSDNQHWYHQVGQELLVFQTPVSGLLTVPAGQPMHLWSPESDRFVIGDVEQVTRIRLPNSSEHALYLQSGRVAVQARPRTVPLEIHTEDCRIKVIGTQFSVQQTGPATRIAVREGRVDVDENGVRTLLHAGEEHLAVAPQSRQFPAVWSAGEPSIDRVALVQAGKILHAGFGNTEDDAGWVVPYHPELRVRLRIHVNEHCHWLGLWWRIPATNTTWYLPLDDLNSGAQMIDVIARLGDGTANGTPMPMPIPGDAISAIRVQVGGSKDAEASIEVLEAIWPK